MMTPEEKLEDAVFLADTGESLIGAAMRLRTSRAALEKFLEREGRPDLVAIFKSREASLHSQKGKCNRWDGAA